MIQMGIFEGIAVGLGFLSILTVLLWCAFLLWFALLPKGEGRSRYGLLIAAIVMGTASYFIDKDVFFGPLFNFIFDLIETLWNVLPPII